MDSKKPLVIAILCSLLIFGGLLVGLLFFLDDDVPPTENDPEVIVEAPPETDPGESQTTSPETTRATDSKRSTAQTLLVTVAAKSGGELIRNSRIIVHKAEEGNRLGKEVHATPKGGRGTSGKFNVPLLAGTYIVRAQAPDFESSRRTVQILKDKGATLQFELGRGLSISGTVYDSSGGHIGGAIVRAYWEIGSPEDSIIERMIGLIDIKERSKETPAQAITNSDGTYQINGVRQGTYYTVTAMAGGFSPKNRLNVRPSAENVDFRLPEGSRFDGTVVDPGGAAIGGAVVGVFPEPDSQDVIKVVEMKARPPIATAVTDSSGVFRLDSLGSGLYNFKITATGFQTKESYKEALRSGENPSKIYTMTPGLILGGVVIDLDDQPVEGARVRPIRRGIGATRQSPINIDWGDGSVNTDKQGQFLFDTLLSGKYDLLVSHADFASKQIRNVQVGSENLTISLTGGGAISGRILAAGSQDPIPGARVIVNDLMDVKKEGIADEDGLYYVGGLNSKQGKRYVTVQAEGYARIANQSIHVEEGRETPNTDFLLQANARVEGRVVNSQGAPVHRARVTVKRPTEKGYPVPVGSGQTDAEGRFQIKMESGFGNTLTVVSGEYLELVSARFDVGPGERHETEELVLGLGGRVEGSVTDAKGTPISGVQIAIKREADTDFNILKTDTSDRRGRFTLKGLEAGVIALRGQSTHFLDGIVGSVRVEEGQVTADVRIVLQQGNQLAGSVLGASGEPVQGASVIVREVVQGYQEYRQMTGAQGTFRFSNLRASDTVEVEISHPQYSPFFGEKVAVGTEDFEARLNRLGGIRGVVVDAEGEPIQSFAVHPRRTVSSSSNPLSNQAALEARTITSDDGSFDYAGIPGSSYDVSVSAPGYAATVKTVKVQDGEVADLGTISLPEGGVVDGVILDAETNQPLAGVKVRVLGGSSRFSAASGLSKVNTDSTGTFEFRGLKDGSSLTVRFEKTGYVRQDIQKVNTRDAGSCRDLRVVMERGGGVNGVVVSVDGQPKANVPVYLRGIGELRGRSVNQTANTRSDGRFSFTGLSAGSYRVTASPSRNRGAVGAVGTTSLDLDMNPGASVDVELVIE